LTLGILLPDPRSPACGLAIRSVGVIRT